MKDKIAQATQFSQNYDTLKTIAETLRNQREANVDELIPMLEEATRAYKACKSRLDAVQAALKDYLPTDAPDETR